MPAYWSMMKCRIFLSNWSREFTVWGSKSESTFQHTLSQEPYIFNCIICWTRNEITQISFNLLIKNVSINCIDFLLQFKFDFDNVHEISYEKQVKIRKKMLSISKINTIVAFQLKITIFLSKRQFLMLHPIIWQNKSI